MNRYEKEQRKKRREFLADLNNHEIEFLQEAEALRAQFNTFKRKLHQALFPEESDFMADDHVDADNRRRGINPMQEEYQIKVNKRRKKMGIKPLAENGMVKYNDSSQYTKELMEKIINSNQTELKALIKSLGLKPFNLADYEDGVEVPDDLEWS